MAGMSLKKKFSAHEWNALRDTPHLVVLATATAGSSGIFGTIGEMMTAGKAVFEATSHANELIRSLAGKDEAKAAQDSIREELKNASPESIPDWLREQALAKSRQTMNLLNMHSPDDRLAMAAWLRDLAKRVAEAAKEGGFLGFGGERVSADEKAFLTALDSALI
jgi:hypothetical protein